MKAEFGVIGGTVSELPLADVESAGVETPYGRCEVFLGSAGGTPTAFVRRHEGGHRRLSSSVNHRANMWALQEAGVRGILGTSVVGVVDDGLPLARAILFDDLFFPDNRLPDGSPCTFFDRPGDPRRGHLIFERPFSPGLRRQVVEAATRLGLDSADGGTYGYVMGPRFNSRSEIQWLKTAGVTAVSQTAGPEAVLAAELEVPYCLVGFGVDYANGVNRPTPPDELTKNIRTGVDVLARLAMDVAAAFEAPGFDTGLVYRVEREL